MLELEVGRVCTDRSNQKVRFRGGFHLGAQMLGDARGAGVVCAPLAEHQGGPSIDCVTALNMRVDIEHGPAVHKKLP
jgi:hypothetical protein